MSEFKDNRRYTTPDISLTQHEIDVSLRMMRTDKAKHDKNQVKLL